MHPPTCAHARSDKQIVTVGNENPSDDDDTHNDDDADNDKSIQYFLSTQASCETPAGGGGAFALLKPAHLSLGSMPFEAETFHILMVRNHPELAKEMETDLRWVPCRAGQPVPPGAISGDEQGSVCVAAFVFCRSCLCSASLPPSRFSCKCLPACLCGGEMQESRACF